MERETPVAEDIRITGENARCDEACKRLLSTKEILAHILKACVEEYRNCDVQDIAGKYIEGQPEVSEVPVMPDETNAPRVRGLSDTDKTMTEGTVTYDIRFMATAPMTGEPIRLIVNIEAQKNYHTGYPLIKRGIYYCSRMISAQYGTEFVKSNYQNIRKVYSIWICLEVPKEWENTITRYHIVEENLVGHAREQTRNYDLLTAVLVGSMGWTLEQAMDAMQMPEADRPKYVEMLRPQ